MIHLMQPSLGQDELDALAEVFASNWPGKGPRTAQFESKFAKYIGAQPCEMAGINCCTEGLFQTLEALKLSSRDEVVLPTISFIGAAHAIRKSGARIRLTDVDLQTLNPRPEHIESMLTPHTKAILVIHYGGHPGWIEEIAQMARTRSIILIEDSACSLGATVNNVSCGIIGDVGLWSFDSMKLLVTGDGGMARITDPELRERFRLGISIGGSQRGFEEASEKKRKWWEVNPQLAGRRAYMNDMMAAIGMVQLKRIDSFIQRRKKIRCVYDDEFNGVDQISLPPHPVGMVDFFYWIQVDGRVRDKLAQRLLDDDIYTTFRYWPLHQTQLYGTSKQFPQADKAARRTLHLPMHQSLTTSEVEYVIERVRFHLRDLGR